MRSFRVSLCVSLPPRSSQSHLRFQLKSRAPNDFGGFKGFGGAGGNASKSFNPAKYCSFSEDISYALELP